MGAWLGNDRAGDQGAGRDWEGVGVSPTAHLYHAQLFYFPVLGALRSGARGASVPTQHLAAFLAQTTRRGLIGYIIVELTCKTNIMEIGEPPTNINKQGVSE